MSDDLVNLAQRWPERAATHYDGCEADHVGCLVKKLAREVKRLTGERDKARVEVERHKTLIAALYYATVWELHRLPATLAPEKAREVMSIVRHVEQRPPITEGEEGTR